MKALQVILVCLLVAVLASLAGYVVGVRRGYHKAQNDDIKLSSRNLEFEAQACLRWLHEFDLGDNTDASNFALAKVQVYVFQAQEERARGLWAPQIPGFYSNAVTYLAEHPGQTSVKSHRPNTSLEPTATAPSVSTNR
jgi:hypothetical protein